MWTDIGSQGLGKLCIEGVMVMFSDVEKKPRPSAVSHVGGINEDLGGVDPEVDQALMRLAGGP